VTSLSVTWLPPPASYSVVWSETHSIWLFSAFYSRLEVTSGQITSLPVTWGHVTSFPVTWLPSLCELQPCRKSSAQNTSVFGCLQPLPGDFRSNDVTSESLLITGDHVTSFPATWLHFPASYSLALGQMHSICQFSAFQSHFQVTSGQMTSLPVTWVHVTWFLVIWLPPPVSYSLVWSKTHSVCQFSAFYSLFQVTSGQMTSLPVTFRHLRPRDVIFCHLTVSSCEQQPCRKSNAQYTPVFNLLQPLPGDFLSNDDTSGSLRSPQVTWRHFLSRLPPPASYSLVGSQMHSRRQFSGFYSHFQETSGQMTSLTGHFRLPEVTWRHFLWRDFLLLRAIALYEVKRTVYVSFRPSTATSMWLPVKWRHFRVTTGHLRSCYVIFCHVTTSSCELQPCRKSNTIYASFRPSTATSMWLPVKWRHCRVTTAHLSSRDIISCHVTDSSGELQLFRKSKTQHTPVFGLLQSLPCDFRSNDVTSKSLLVTWSNVMSFPVT